MYIRYTDDIGMNEAIQLWLDAVTSMCDIIRPIQCVHYTYIFNKSNKKNLSELEILFTVNQN